MAAAVKTLVFGAAGQLGAAVAAEFASAGAVVPLTRTEVDITDGPAVAGIIHRERPDAIVNCAAYNLVDAAEDEPVTALAVNAIALRSMARAAAEVNAVLVHYSSDFVFDGTASEPYTEENRPNPQSVYATSKLLGEWFAADAPRHYVLRVESLFGAEVAGGPAKGSVVGILNGFRAGRPPRVFADRTITPTYVIDAARATRELIERRAPFGLYHCVNSQACTWADLAEEVARRLGIEPRMERVQMADANLKAKRPLYCAMSNAKLAAAGVVMPSWQDAIGRYLAVIG